MTIQVVIFPVVVWISFFTVNLWAQEFIGDPTGLSNITDSDIGKAVVQDTDVNFDIKNESELDQYFRCHMNTGKSDKLAAEKTSQYEEYKNTYGKYNQWAAETFGIPKALLECSIFRETLFEKMSTSGVGARGIAQIMPATYLGLRNEIQRVYSTVVSEIKYKQLLSENNTDEITPKMMVPDPGSHDVFDDNFLKC